MKRYAIPTERDEQGRTTVCAHFGHCRELTLIDLDTVSETIVQERSLVPPEHEPGVLPRWIAELGAGIVLTGGMGHRARQILEQRGVEVITGVTTGSPEQIVLGHANGTLVSGQNRCDH